MYTLYNILREKKMKLKSIKLSIHSSYVVSEGNSGTACDVASNVFNSELGSNYLAHYGLDGPLAEYQPPPSEYGNDAPEEPSEVDMILVC